MEQMQVVIRLFQGFGLIKDEDEQAIDWGHLQSEVAADKYQLLSF